jgi:ribosome biogenesis protein YTM1
VSSYLSHVRVLPLAGGIGDAPTPLYTLPLPTALGATCCTWLEDDMVAAGGVDRATHVFRIPSFDPAEAAAENNTAKELYTLMGHAAPIASIAAGPARELASGAWDGQINVYALPAEEPTEHELAAEPTSYLPGQKKRRKLMKETGAGPAPIEGLTDGDATGESGMGWRRAPTLVLRAHKGRVGGLLWDKEDGSRLWSAGWDGSVRGWDAETGANVVFRVSRACNAVS